MEKDFGIKASLAVFVLVVIAVSAGEMLNGNEERGVLICFWASLLVGLYGVSK